MGPSCVHIIYPRTSAQQTRTRCHTRWQGVEEEQATEGRQPGHTALPGLLAAVSLFALTLRREKFAPTGTGSVAAPVASPRMPSVGRMLLARGVQARKAKPLEILAQLTPLVHSQHLQSTNLGSACSVSKLGRPRCAACKLDNPLRKLRHVSPPARQGGLHSNFLPLVYWALSLKMVLSGGQRQGWRQREVQPQTREELHPLQPRHNTTK